MTTTDILAYREMETECKIHLISSAEECTKILNTIKFEDIIGLDCEWKPDTFTTTEEKKENKRKKNKVALLQLATNKHILLIHLHSIGFIPASLEKILTDHNIVKVGVAINSDKQKLRSDYGVDVMDTRNIDPGQKGLAKLVRHYLHVELPKLKRVRCSNWEMWPLTRDQVLYAAADAYYSLRLMGSITVAIKESHSQTPLREEKEEKEEKGGIWPSDMQSTAGRSSLKRKKCVATGKPIKIHHIRIYSFDGTYTHISPDRLSQFLSEGIIVRSDPSTIHPVCLPDFMGAGETKMDCYYYTGTQKKKEFPTLEIGNWCTVCGQKEDLHRWSVVGDVYHKMLNSVLGHAANEKFLLNSSFNKLVVCGSCFVSCQQYVTTYINNLRQTFRDEKTLTRLNELSSATKMYYSKEQTKHECSKKIIADFLGNGLTPALVSVENVKNMQKIIREMFRKERPKIETKIEDYFKNIIKENPRKFVALWRHLFLEHIQPKYLPEKLLTFWKSVE